MSAVRSPTELNASENPAEAELIANRDDLYLASLAHTRDGMRRHDIPVLVIVDPNQIFYSTGTANMQIWSARTPAPYLLIFLEGPVILYDFAGSQHLAQGLPTIDEIRLAEGVDHVSSGEDLPRACDRFAQEIAAMIRSHDPAIDHIAVDRFPFQAVDALRGEGLDVVDALEALSLTRAIKLPIELPYIREAMRRVELGVRRLEERAEPSLTEAETWAEFHYEMMAKHGH